MVIFDGLDELIDISLRRDVVQAVEGFAYRYPTVQIIVTSRRIGYEDAPLDPDLFPVAQLMELDDGRVRALRRLELVIGALLHGGLTMNRKAGPPHWPAMLRGGASTAFLIALLSSCSNSHPSSTSALLSMGTSHGSIHWASNASGRAGNFSGTVVGKSVTGHYTPDNCGFTLKGTFGRVPFSVPVSWCGSGPPIAGKETGTIGGQVVHGTAEVVGQKSNLYVKMAVTGTVGRDHVDATFWVPLRPSGQTTSLTVDVQPQG